MNINNEIYEVVIIRKDNKNIYIRVKEDLKIYITCPKNISEKYIQDLLYKSKASIAKMIDKQKNKRYKAEKNSGYYLGNKIDIVFCNIISETKLENNRLLVRNKKDLDKWYKNRCEIEFKFLLDNIYPIIAEKIPYPKIKLRTMKTRWGVCNRKDNSITLNTELIKYKANIINYVIIHELVHFIHFNHSNNFWMVVEKYYPNYREVRRELKE